MLCLLVLKVWRVVVLTKNILFFFVLKGWQVVVLTKKKSVDALGILGLTCGLFNKKPVDSLGVEG
jgi:hypothetical protein